MTTNCLSTQKFIDPGYEGIQEVNSNYRQWITGFSYDQNYRKVGINSDEFMKSLTNYHDMNISDNDLGWTKDYRVGHSDGEIKGKQSSFERMKIGQHAYPYLWGPDYWNVGKMDGIGDNEGPRGEALIIYITEIIGEIGGHFQLLVIREEFGKI